ncbi:hypothetical protein AFCDBAGC_4834 [Methylobacterium cerastii]|uniref:Uncharacterized protein n=1 Tax=Methylobacterium cerastii TaxID=932741 RepID=A0ABQ4QNZ7_9HYPH|nr:hypothetical protein [Methylobacterium cerastii]GJD46949.1 hypothetical protein AFCDBAGC_4834 [Methylobacterium cerastii]
MRMSNANDLEFKSTFVLMKIGHDLKESLEDTVEALIPEPLEAVAAEIQDKDTGKSVIPLNNIRYAPHDDDTLF